MFIYLSVKPILSLVRKIIITNILVYLFVTLTIVISTLINLLISQ